MVEYLMNGKLIMQFQYQFKTFSYLTGQYSTHDPTVTLPGWAKPTPQFKINISTTQ